MFRRSLPRILRVLPLALLSCAPLAQATHRLQFQGAIVSPSCQLQLVEAHRQWQCPDGGQPSAALHVSVESARLHSSRLLRYLNERSPEGANAQVLTVIYR